MHCLIAKVKCHYKSFSALPHCLRGVGSDSMSVCFLTSSGPRAVEPLLYTSSLPRGSGQWNVLCNAHYLGGVGSDTSFAHHLLPRGSKQCNLVCTASLHMGTGH